MSKLRSDIIQLRSRPSGKVELRQAGESESIILDGVPVVYNSESVEMWGFVEIIRTGAYTKTLQESTDIASFNSHLHEQILGRVPDTLRLIDSATELKSEITIDPEVTYAMNLVRNIRAKKIYTMSHGFQSIKTRWTYNDGEEPDLCELLEGKLFEVSPVAFAAYPATSVGERSLKGLAQLAADGNVIALEGLTRRSALGDTRAAEALAKIMTKQFMEPEPGSPHSGEPTDEHSSGEEPNERHSLSPELYERIIQIHVEGQKLII